MDVKLKEVTVAELIESYSDDGDGGVVGFGGNLDIRPQFQREFVYKEKQRNAVIDTINKSFPLNVMYWADIGGDRYEIIDGQQRTISICQYTNNDFSVGNLFFSNLPHDKQELMLAYKLMVYVCSGTDSEKLDWFETINIAGEKLTAQELRNAVYSGPWVSDAKRYFSRNGGPAHQVGGNYLNGATNRQEYLETAISWASDGKIEEYMGRHQDDGNAEPLWEHFQTVIGWVESTFSTYRKEMKGLSWGSLYATHKNKNLDPTQIETEVAALMSDEEIKMKCGIYEYVLTRDERHLNLRAFEDHIKRTVYEKQGGKCAITGELMKFDDMEADHITPWSRGGKTVEENCQMISKQANRRKGVR
ncbi:MAG: DUF262 domain-containing protein [bacterium]|nr:DUF262 domain-containing protein [bacterium]